MFSGLTLTSVGVSLQRCVHVRVCVLYAEVRVVLCVLLVEFCGVTHPPVVLVFTLSGFTERMQVLPLQSCRTWQSMRGSPGATSANI